MSEPDWQHLEAVIDELVAAGIPRSTPFAPSQGGWWCSMSKPLDPDVARRIVASDARLTYEESNDTIVVSTLLGVDLRRDGAPLLATALRHFRADCGMSVHSYYALRASQKPIGLRSSTLPILV